MSFKAIKNCQWDGESHRDGFLSSGLLRKLHGNPLKERENQRIRILILNPVLYLVLSLKVEIHENGVTKRQSSPLW